MHKLAVPDWESDIDWERSEREYRAEYGPSWLYVQKRKAAIYREQRQEMSVVARVVDYLLELLFPRGFVNLIWPTLIFSFGPP
jgi:hypothetical protein